MGVNASTQALFKGQLYITLNISHIHELFIIFKIRKILECENKNLKSIIISLPFVNKDRDRGGLVWD